MLADIPAPWILWDMVFLFPRIHVSSNHGLGAGFRPTDWTSSPWAPNSVAASSASASRGKEIGLRWEGHSLNIHWTLMDIDAHWPDKWRRPTRWGNKLTTWEWPLSITWRISQLWDHPTVKDLLFNEACYVLTKKDFFMSCPAAPALHRYIFGAPMGTKLISSSEFLQRTRTCALTDHQLRYIEVFLRRRTWT
jgi:hypothetical protein